MSVNDIVVRKARFVDARYVADLIREVAGDAEEHAIRRRFRRMLLRPSYTVYVAVKGSRRVALMLFRRGHFLGADAPMLLGQDIAVDPEFRRQGIAARLIESVEKTVALEGFNQVWFVTQHEYLHEMYQGLGYTNTGTRFVKHLSGARPLSLWHRAGRSVARRIGF